MLDDHDDYVNDSFDDFVKHVDNDYDDNDIESQEVK
jgi:hypothetical protein